MYKKVCLLLFIFSSSIFPSEIDTPPSSSRWKLYVGGAALVTGAIGVRYLKRKYHEVVKDASEHPKAYTAASRVSIVSRLLLAFNSEAHNKVLKVIAHTNHPHPEDLLQLKWCAPSAILDSYQMSSQGRVDPTCFSILEGCIRCGKPKIASNIFAVSPEYIFNERVSDIYQWIIQALRTTSEPGASDDQKEEYKRLLKDIITATTTKEKFRSYSVPVIALKYHQVDTLSYLAQHYTHTLFDPIPKTAIRVFPSGLERDDFYPLEYAWYCEGWHTTSPSTYKLKSQKATNTIQQCCRQRLIKYCTNSKSSWLDLGKQHRDQQGQET